MRCQVALGVLAVERETIISYFLYQHSTPPLLYDPFATAHVRAGTHTMPRVLYIMYDHVTHSNYRSKSPLTKFIVCCVLLSRLTVTSHTQVPATINPSLTYVLQVAQRDTSRLAGQGALHILHVSLQSLRSPLA